MPLFPAIISYLCFRRFDRQAAGPNPNPKHFRQNLNDMKRSVLLKIGVACGALAAAACGLSRSQAMFHLFLPAAARGILGGVVQAVGRAAEDTAVILFTGVVANAGMPAGLLGKFEALSFDIYYISSQYQDQQELLRGFGAAALLLCISCLLLLAARVLENGFRKKWQGRA